MKLKAKWKYHLMFSVYKEYWNGRNANFPNTVSQPTALNGLISINLGTSKAVFN